MELHVFLETDDLNTKIWKWSENQKAVAEFKTVEMEQRKLLDAELFANPKNGKNKHELPQGWSIESTHGTETKLDEAAYKLIESDLDDSIKDVCVNWKPSLDVRAYKKIPEKKRALLDEAVTTKPKAPSMKLVPPKEAK